MDWIEDGSIRITADDFPSFVYESGTVYDEDNKNVGLFRGYLLVWASTGLSSVLNPTSKGSHKMKAKKFKLTKVTPWMIAYASVQVSCLQANIDSLVLIWLLRHLKDRFKSVKTKNRSRPKKTGLKQSSLSFEVLGYI